jgi:ATP-dependent DNA ligase
LCRRWRPAAVLRFVANASANRLCCIRLLWLEGEDLSNRPLMERKVRLQKLLPKNHHALLYVPHFESPGAKVLKQVCAMDLEGIVAKRKSAPYGGTASVKILNPDYSQRRGRAELFKKKA